MRVPVCEAFGEGGIVPHAAHGPVRSARDGRRPTSRTGGNRRAHRALTEQPIGSAARPIPVTTDGPALAAIALLLVAACAGSTAGDGSRVVSKPPSTPTSASPSPSGCPSPQPLADGKAIAIDYVDFVAHDGVTFLDSRATPAGPTALVAAADIGPVVFTIACQLSKFTLSGRVQPPGLPPDSAGFLPAGTEVHSVRGYPATCRLAALRNGVMTLYLAQREVDKVSTTEPCALARAGAASASSPPPTG